MPNLSPPTWDEFRNNLPSRLTLPIRRFRFDVNYVPVSLADAPRRAFTTIIVDSVVNALENNPDCSLEALRVVENMDVNVSTGLESEQSYITCTFASPVYDFALQAGPSILRLSKERTTLENLLLTIKIFSDIAQQLFASGDESPDLIKAGIRPHRIAHRFEHELVLGHRLSDDTAEVTNLVLLEQLAFVSASNPQELARSPLAALQPDSILRGDVFLVFKKVLQGRPREVYINYEGPWNITQRDIDIEVTYEVGGSPAPMMPQDLLDFRTPMIDFYHDLIIRRFFTDLFKDIQVQGRV